jgi:NAD(P)-dependent dehydrogenase (short-subunit alcohol dehydrogenase family)
MARGRAAAQGLNKIFRRRHAPKVRRRGGTPQTGPPPHRQGPAAGRHGGAGNGESMRSGSSPPRPATLTDHVRPAAGPPLTGVFGAWCPGGLAQGKPIGLRCRKPIGFTLEMDMTSLKDSVALVTGGSRGLGRALVQALYERGAAKVYATARDPRTVTHPDAVPLALEVTDPDSVRAAAARAEDVTVLINNAGISLKARSFLDSPVEDIRREFETNFYGPLLVTRAFVPVLERNGGGHLLNVHSVLSWLGVAGSYSATKAALWSQTNTLRLELQPRGIAVTGLHVGYIDTDMAAGIDAPKSTPGDVAGLALDGIEAGAHEVLADDLSREVKAGLSADLAVLYPQLAG